MASGTINLGTDNHLTGQILWTATPNGTEANTSTIAVTLQVARAYGSQYTTGGTFTGSVTIGAATKSFSEYEEVSTKWVTLFTYTEIKEHNSDGTGTCVIGATIKGPKGTTMEGRSVSASEIVTLDTIPRGAVITSAPNFTDEENPTITYSNPAGNTVTALEACISLDSSNDDVAYRSISKTGTSYTFNLTEAERNVLRAATTDGNTRTVIFYIRTTIGSSLLYSASSRTFTVTEPNPTINPSVTDNNNTTYNLTGNRNTLVKYYSNAAVTIGAAAVKGATLVSQKVTCGNKSLTANGTINAVESGTFVFTATDSRGNTTTKTVTQPFVEYIKLTCDLANNVPDGTGTMAVRISGNYFNSSFGSRNNSLTVYYRYKKSGGSFGNWTRINATISGNTYSATANVTGLDYRAAYVFEAYAVDALATVYSASKTVKSTPVFDWGENDFDFNVPVAMNGNVISGLPTPTNGTEAVPKNYVDGKYLQATESSDHPGCYYRTVNGKTEWINPPLILGTEYRIADRYLGKVVYTMAFLFGLLPNESAKSVSVPAPAAGASHVVSAIAVTTAGAFLNVVDSASAYTVWVKTSGDYSTTNANIIIKYTKD